MSRFIFHVLFVVFIVYGEYSSCVYAEVKLAFYD